MNFFKLIERVQRLNQLITHECTGTPEELSQRLCVSKRQVHNLIESLRNMGADISYDKTNKTYRYNESEVKIDFTFEVLDRSATQQIEGGMTLRKIPECNFISLWADRLVAC